MGKLLRRRSAVRCSAVLCCAGGEAEGGLAEQSGRRRSAASQGLVGHEGMGTGDMGPAVERRGKNDGSPLGPGGGSVRST